MNVIGLTFQFILIIGKTIRMDSIDAVTKQMVKQQSFSLNLTHSEANALQHLLPLRYSLQPLQSSHTRHKKHMKTPNKQRCSFHNQQSKFNEHDQKPPITEITKQISQNDSSQLNVQIVQPLSNLVYYKQTQKIVNFETFPSCSRSLQSSSLQISINALLNEVNQQPLLLRFFGAHFLNFQNKLHEKQIYSIQKFGCDLDELNKIEQVKKSRPGKQALKILQQLVAKWKISVGLNSVDDCKGEETAAEIMMIHKEIKRNGQAQLRRLNEIPKYVGKKECLVKINKIQVPRKGQQKCKSKFKTNIKKQSKAQDNNLCLNQQMQVKAGDKIDNLNVKVNDVKCFNFMNLQKKRKQLDDYFVQKELPVKHMIPQKRKSLSRQQESSFEVEDD